MRTVFAFLLAFVSLSSMALAAAPFDARACRDQLGARIRVEGAPAPSSETIALFEQVFDLYPEPVQRLMCRIKVFNIDDFTDSSAFTCGEGCDSISIRKGLFDRGLTLEEWASWKDQLNFGERNDNAFLTTPELPMIRTDQRFSFLYFLLLHELGHTIVRSSAELYQWDALSADPGNAFAGKSELCSYWCQRSPIDRARADKIYRDLFEHTNFLSLYGARLTEEDFADSFALYVMIDVMKHSYEVRMPSGTVYSVGARMHAPSFGAKLRFLQTVYGELSAAER